MVSCRLSQENQSNASEKLVFGIPPGGFTGRFFDIPQEVFGNLSPGPLETGLRHLATFAPGDALLDRSNSMWMLRVAAAPRFFKRPFESGMMGLRQA